MKCFAALTALALCANTVSAHYIAQYLSVGGTKYGQYQHVRKNTNNNSPVTSLSDTNLRCNVGGATGGSTTTVDVAAGSAFTFTYDQAVYHQGPVSFYMSKAPGAAKDYDGSGQWFKFKEIGPTFSGSQASWNMATTYTANIPKCIPNGEYLLRIEQLGIHNPGSPPQFYISCAQVRVTGGGSTSPAITTSIPGHVKSSDSGFTANIYNPSFTSYVVPGPKVWNC